MPLNVADALWDWSVRVKKAVTFWRADIYSLAIICIRVTHTLKCTSRLKHNHTRWLLQRSKEFSSKEPQAFPLLSYIQICTFYSHVSSENLINCVFKKYVWKPKHNSRCLSINTVRFSQIMWNIHLLLHCFILEVILTIYNASQKIVNYI